MQMDLLTYSPSNFALLSHFIFPEPAGDLILLSACSVLVAPGVSPIISEAFSAPHALTSAWKHPHELPCLTLL